MSEFNLTTFVQSGFCDLGGVLPKEKCLELLRDVKATREFSSALFQNESEYRANPQHKGVNPITGRNLVEQFDLDWIESAPALTEALSRVLGSGFRVLNKKFVVGVPESWMPGWLLRETAGLRVANLGAYIRPQYRDMTYFHGIDFHQDIIDYKERVSDFVTLYIYLDSADATTSPLFVIPESHRFGATVFPHQVTLGPSDVRYDDGRGQAGTFALRMLTGEPGSVYFWHACILHGTQPHTATHPRISLRYLIEQADASAGLLAKANASIAGPLSLATTRTDLDDAGVAKIRGNSINELDSQRQQSSPEQRSNQ